jgi:hypothetical protein
LERLEPLHLGTEKDPASMEPREYKLKVGKGYRWKIVASDLNEYALVAPAFFRNIYVRKVEVAGVEIKAPTFDEIEFENGGEAELFFVAVRPGSFEFGPKGMMERGVVGKFIVESTDASAADAKPDAAAGKKADIAADKRPDDDDGDDGNDDEGGEK